jgi:hypothetical protein
VTHESNDVFDQKLPFPLLENSLDKNQSVVDWKLVTSITVTLQHVIVQATILVHCNMLGVTYHTGKVIFNTDL